MAIQDFGAFRSLMEPYWEKSNALEGGTEELRRHGQTYLPKFENETDKNHERRLSLATLTNFYVKAANQMVGEIFREGLDLKDSTLPEEIISDLDRRGTDIEGFAQATANMLLRKDVAGILIDHPDNDGDITLAQEKEMGLRHYWTLIDPDCVIDIKSTFEAGKETIFHVRWFEAHSSAGEDEFSFNTTLRIIVLDRQITVDEETGRRVIGKPRGRIYEGPVKTSDGQNVVARDADGKLRLASSGVDAFKPVTEWKELTGFKEIPFVPIQVNRKSLFVGRPLLADIAEKNLQHWRQSSNYHNALEIGAFPVLVRYGLNTDPHEVGEDGEPLEKNDDGEYLFGPHVIMDMPSTQEGAAAEYVEPSGRAYEALENAMDRMIKEAELMALDLLVKQFQKTATEANYDRLTTLAPLAKVAVVIETAFARALAITAEARQRNEKPGYVEIDKDFGISASDAIRVQALRDARVIGDITPETYIAELQNIGAISASLDPKVEVEAAQAGADVDPDAE